jgi:hypothetical protein
LLGRLIKDIVVARTVWPQQQIIKGELIISLVKRVSSPQLLTLFCFEMLVVEAVELAAGLVVVEHDCQQVRQVVVHANLIDAEVCLIAR